jgi:hypothetical protein
MKSKASLQAKLTWSIPIFRAGFDDFKRRAGTRKLFTLSPQPKEIRNVSQKNIISTFQTMKKTIPRSISRAHPLAITLIAFDFIVFTLESRPQQNLKTPRKQWR